MSAFGARLRMIRHLQMAIILTGGSVIISGTRFRFYKNGLQPGSVSFIANDELHINFGKEIVNNYFDQNRFFLGFKYQFTGSSNVQLGYMNLFQQLAAGNKYKNINAIRVFFFQNFDLRKKAKAS